MLAPWKKSYDKPRQHIKKQRHHFANKGLYSQSYVVLEKTLEGPLDCKEIQPVLPKGDQSWVFSGRIDAEADSNILAT